MKGTKYEYFELAKNCTIKREAANTHFGICYQQSVDWFANTNQTRLFSVNFKKYD